MEENEISADVLPAPEREKRRYHRKEFKERLVALVNEGDRSLAEIAMTHQVNANLLRKWVRTHEISADATIKIAPIRMMPSSDSSIEVNFPSASLRVVGSADPELVSAIIKVLR